MEESVDESVSARSSNGIPSILTESAQNTPAVLRLSDLAQNAGEQINLNNRFIKYTMQIIGF